MFCGLLASLKPPGRMTVRPVAMLKTGRVAALPSVLLVNCNRELFAPVTLMIVLGAAVSELNENRFPVPAPALLMSMNAFVSVLLITRSFGRYELKFDFN